MYNYYFCSKINDDFYDHKLDINKLSYLINKYDLKCNGSIKEYWINNVRIISNNDLISSGISETLVSNALISLGTPIICIINYKLCLIIIYYYIYYIFI
mgnify:CR=1 FL=1